METLIWHAQLEADFHRRYWAAVAKKYGKSERVLKTLLAMCALGAVATWSIWEEYGVFWKSFSATTAVLAVAAPFIQCGRKRNAAANLAARWTELRTAYEQVWKLCLASGETEAMREEYQRLNHLYGELQKNAPGLHIAQDDKLVRQARQQVLNAHGARSATAASA